VCSAYRKYRAALVPGADGPADSPAAHVRGDQAGVVVRESLNQPLILIFEDLHWLDSETQAFLSLLSESLATAPILLLMNYRPEYRHEWGSRTFYTQLRLDPLGQEDAQELLTALLGDDPALHPLKQFILTKTEGNPFFMEEIVQALVEQGVLRRDIAGGRLRPGVSSLGQVPLPTDLRLPTTVQGVLSARIDRLPAEEKELLQTLAVIGKKFGFVANFRQRRAKLSLYII
jgi:predicted ATPase